MADPWPPKACGFAVEQLPSNSPDFSPIENCWAWLNERLAETDPATPEKFDAFKQRVRNAVGWLHENKAGEMANLIPSMQRRLQAAIRLKGARTGY